MKLEDVALNGMLIRPEEGKRYVNAGTYTGEIVQVELVERECNYNEDKKRVVVNFKIEIEDEEVTLYFSPNLAWTKHGKLVRTLEKLGALPELGESLQLEKMVGISVRVTVENNEKEGTTYSNIINVESLEKTN